MKKALRTGLLAAGLASAAAVLAGCADDKMLNDQMQMGDFGRAVQEDLAAQIADPDATYKGPPPPSSGERAALAQKRYQADHVIMPANTSSGGSSSSGGGGGGGGSGGSGGQ